ncbi:hypothetical protein CONPUDRAFT_76705 [Coniophora puteana RWD-64-598 SS2]|uniref:Ubiquitin 3 binding protein But2 C-terminal domain-containing protein n=1 Tax=Coniophora puteana (strain RWD-64-598) TaxID=741705 RepID=A0A5M3MCI3_CONPW|nr:uncharacterized protein CONPUDRAFT_76705 [Coniophora puteana RWD-64-598 SS2]EIW76345.1 hypothetical protein CONPUDRAFT_76705 [Coniophora puteana RWD-64-598 SS2]
MGPSSADYARLPSASDEDSEQDIFISSSVKAEGLTASTVELVEQPYRRTEKFKRVDKPTLFLGLGVAACFLLTLVNTIYFIRTPSFSPNPWSTANNFAGASLPRPNQFVGLDKVDRNRSGFVTPPPFMNRVSVLTQVSSEHPDYVYPDGQRQWYSFRGTVSPSDKPFLVNQTVGALNCLILLCTPHHDQHLVSRFGFVSYTLLRAVFAHLPPQTSTIAQFRTLDFGMENCEVAVRVLPQDILDAETDLRPGFNRTFISSRPNEPLPISVYELHMDKPLDVRTLSWRTKPERGKFLGVEAELQTISCPQDSLQTFEFICDEQQEEACSLEWWQDEHESLGVFLKQSSSIPDWSP